MWGGNWNRWKVAVFGMAVMVITVLVTAAVVEGALDAGVGMNDCGIAGATAGTPSGVYDE